MTDDTTEIPLTVVADSGNSSNNSEFNFGLVSQAFDEFTGKRYEQSLETLRKLQEVMPDDSKIAHNKAIVEFYNSDQKKFDRLLEFLNNEIKDFENDNSESKKNRNMSVIYYNKAVILYHQGCVFSALQLLSPLVEKLDEIDECVSSRIGLLYLTILIETNQLKKAQKFCKILHNYVDGQNSEGATALPSISESNCDNTDNFNRTFKLISLLTSIVNEENVTVPEDMGFEFKVLKAYKYYIGKDFQMAAKELHTNFVSDLMTAKTHGEDSDVCVANNMGIIHLRVRNYALAMSFFQHALNFDARLIEDVNSIDKEENLKLNDKNNLKHELPLYCIEASKELEIFYNLGISLLHLERPEEAFDLFMKVVQKYHQNPRLWLRIAEACIMSYEKNKKASEKKVIVSSIIGSGMQRKYILEPTPKIKYPPTSSNDDCSTTTTTTNPKPTLEFAAHCLQNAVILVEYYQNIHKESKKDEKENKEDADVVENHSNNIIEDRIFCNPSMPISEEALERLTSAIYAAHSYVSIHLGDYNVGLHFARRLLQQKDLSDANKMLAHLYCAEALVNIGKLNEAKEYLNLSIDPSSHDFETKNWKVNTPIAAQAILKYNLMVTLILQGEYAAAKLLFPECHHYILDKKIKGIKAFMELAKVGDRTNVESSNI